MNRIWGLACLALVACGGGNTEAKAPESKNEADVLTDESPTGASSSSAEVQKAEDAIKKEDFATAKQLLSDVVAKNPKDAKAAFYLGVAEGALGETEPAIVHLKQALAIEPSLVEASLNLSALLLDAQQYEAAIAAAEQGLKHAPNDEGLQLNRAMALSASAQWAKAAEAFAAIAPKHADDEGLQFSYGEALAGAGKDDEAVKQLMPLTRSEKPEVLASTADQLARLKQWDGCIQAIDRAIQKREASELTVKRGLCRHGKKDEAGARADFEKAVKQDPKSVKAHFYLGQSLAAKGDKKAAKAAFAKVLELDPTGPFAKAAAAAK